MQAAIAALHAQAVSWEQTDWPQIVALYDELVRMQPSPVFALNRAVAVAMAAGPARGLDALGQIDDARMQRSHLFYATRADLLRRLGRNDEAAVAYRGALDAGANDAEQRYLRRRLAECGGRSDSVDQGRIERSNASSA